MFPGLVFESDVMPGLSRAALIEEHTMLTPTLCGSVRVLPSGVVKVAVACSGYVPQAADDGTATDQPVVRVCPGPSELAEVGPFAEAVQPLGTLSDTDAPVAVPVLALPRMVCTDAVWPGVTVSGALTLSEQHPKPAAKMCIAVEPCVACWLTSGSVRYFTVLPAWSGIPT